MNEPDWKTCTEEILWRYIAWHLEAEGISSVLVGGAVVAIYSEGLYRSGDLDMVPDELHRHRIPGILGNLGFLPSKSRYYKHPECPHLFLDFPRGPVELGEEYPIIPAEITVEGRIIKLLSPTDCVKDRMAAFIHWKARAGLNQAALVCRRQKHQVDLGQIRSWCEGEGDFEAFDELLGLLSESPQA